MTSQDNGWDEMKRLVISKLDDLTESTRALNKKVDRLGLDVAGLKVKSGIWGALGGAIPLAIAALVWYLRSGQ